MSKRYSKGSQRYSNYHPAELAVPKYRGKTLSVPNTGLNVQVYHMQREIFVKLHKPRSDREISLKVPEFRQLTAPMAVERILKEVEECDNHIKRYHPEGATTDNYVPEEIEELPVDVPIEAKRIKIDNINTNNTTSNQGDGQKAQEE